MSILLQSLVWEIKFPTQTQKLVMLKVADHSSDQGENIWPSNETLAYQVGCDVRSIQRAVKAIEQAGLLVLEHRGGRGDGDTNKWRINVELLAKLASRDLDLVSQDGCVRVVENEGDILPPSAFARVTRALRRVTPVSSEGGTSVTQTTKNHHLEPSDARERARDSSRAPRARVAIRLTPQVDPVQFGHWLDRMAECNRDDLVTAARDTGHIIVATRWPPDEGLRGLISAGSVDVTERMMGEADA